MGKNYIRRGQWFHYLRRVPNSLSSYDKREHIRIALKTKDEREAAKLAGIYNDFVERYWRDLIKARTSDTELERFADAKALARAHGFAYKDLSEIAAGSLDDLLSRVEAIKDDPQIKAPALLGTARVSGTKLEDCLEEYWPLCEDRLIGRSEPQRRKFKNPKKAAMTNFIGAIGNVELERVSRSEILQFRNCLIQRVTKRQITGGTANKQIAHVKDVLATVGRNEEVDTDFNLIFAQTKLASEPNSRPPFEASFVQDRILDGRSLANLNFDARMIVYLMVETGARESEIIGTTPEDFFLDSDIPYIWMRKNRLRTLKTRTSERKIPLVGVSLEAARQVAATGISRYQDNPYSASATINKYLKEHDLRPTTKHTLYSLRHTFKDRLRDNGAPEEVIDELMGHRKSGPKYGRGHLLETKHRWLKEIEFRMPTISIS